MQNWEKLLLNPDVTILEALKTISEGAAQIVLVVESDRRLLGTVTDGDIRRGILSGYALSDPISIVMNVNPVKFVGKEATRDHLMETMLKKHIHQLPIVDSQNRVVGLETIDELLKPASKDNLVVVMSGGVGKRLQPLTNDTPKPMLTVGEKPLLELNLEKLRAQGFKRFCFTVGYKAEVIKNYFQKGEKWDVSIDYIHEETPLGTAGGLYYLAKKETNPIIVMNGDLLTAVNFNNLLSFHDKSKADCTVCVREFETKLPYGIIEVKNHRVISIQEKPVYKYFVNAGIYVICSDLLQYIPPNEYYQMTTFLEKLIHLKCKVEAFPLMEYWSDIGQPFDYEKTCQEFEELLT